MINNIVISMKLFSRYSLYMSTPIVGSKKLAIYYGYPSLINGANGNIASAVAAFNVYDQIVLGDGLEALTHPDHANTTAIITDASMANTEVYGYIDSTLSLDTIQTNIDLWATMGVKGIFCDKFGYDFAVSRLQQREIIWCVHTKPNLYGSPLKAYVNCWNPDDAFSPAVQATYNPSGLVTRLGSTDYYLAESFAVINGVYDDTDTDSDGIKDFQDKAVKMTTYNATYGTNMTAIATLGAVTFTQNLADYSYFAATLNNFYSWGFAMQYYSASSCSMPFITRKPFYGTKFTDSVTNTSGVMERQTNIGIHVDTTAHTVNTLLN